MFRRKFLALFLVLILATLVATGCGDSRSASQILQDAFTKSAEIKSYAFDGSLTLQLDIPEEVKETLTPEELMGFEIFKDAKIVFNGAYQLEPFQTEVVLSMDLNLGDLKTTISLPILMDEKNIWVKVPNIPGIPELQDLAGKFIELNFEELAALSGEEVPDFAANIEAQTKMGQEMAGIFFKHFDDSYFTKLKVKELNLDKSLEAKNAVEFKITQENLKPMISIVIDKVAPEVIDLMSKPEYQEFTQMTPEMAAETKKGLLDAKANLDLGMEEFNKYVKITNGSIILVEGKQGFIRQQKFDLAAEVTPEEVNGKLNVGLSMVQNVTNINGTQTFTNSFPPAEDQVIPFADLMGYFFGMGMGMSFDEDSYEEGVADEGSVEGDSEFVEMDDELTMLQSELLAQPWFYENQEILSLLETNEDFYNALFDAEILSALLYDPDYRQEFFASYEIQIATEE